MIHRERLSNGTFAPEHGGKHSKLYGVWCGMKERCNNAHNKRYQNYGAKGIKVCEEWSSSFAAFRDWAISNGYEEGLTIDRVDFNKGYFPENCRWATHSQQNRNYSRNHFITYMGETKCLSDWADEFGINRSTILLRIKRGKTLEEVFSKIDGRTTRWHKN